MRPLFVSDPSFGGVIDRYPRVTQSWTGDNVGDFYVGAKINFWSEYRAESGGDCVRGMVKTADRRNRTSASAPGKADGSIDSDRQQGSGEAGRSLGLWRLRIPGQSGRLRRPDRRVPLGRGRSAFPSRNFLRVVGELNGSVPIKRHDHVTAPLWCGDRRGAAG